MFPLLAIVPAAAFAITPSPPARPVPSSYTRGVLFRLVPGSSFRCWRDPRDAWFPSLLRGPCVVQSLIHIRLFVTSWTVSRQAALSMEFSRPEHWSGLPLPSPGDLPDPGIEPKSPALKADSLSTELPGKPLAPSKRPGLGRQGRQERKGSILLNMESGVTLVLIYMQRRTSGHRSVKNC